MFSKILSTGSYLPQHIRTNADLEKMVDTSDEWIVTRSGIRERRIAAPDETVSTMGFEAAQKAIEAANINRTVKASVKQQEDILLIKELIGLDQIEPGLREIAEQRLRNPDASLEELSQGLITPISKSGVNHRLRKLAKIAKGLREEFSR